MPQWKGVLEGARRRGGNVVSFAGGYLLTKNANDAQANIAYDLAKSERLDGLVLWTGGLDSLVTPAEVAEFADSFRPLPVVVVEHPIAGFPSLVLDDYEAMREMMTHLIVDHRYQKFAYIQSSSTDHYGIAARYRAFTETLAEHGLPFDPLMLSPPFFFETRENSPGLREWVRRLPLGEKVAIVGHNDIAALGALEVIHSLGLQVPKDLALVGYDDIDECRSVTPPLTTMRPPFRELGIAAAETLIDLIEGKGVPEYTCLRTPLVIRRSCGCQDTSVLNAALAPRVEGPARAAPLDSQRTAMLEALAPFFDSLGSETSVSWAERLADSLLDKATWVEGGFLGELDAALYQALKTDSEVMPWQEAISALRRLVLPRLTDGDSLRMEDLCHQARTMIAAASQRQEAARAHEAANRWNSLRRIQEELITTFDVGALMKVLQDNLPFVGVPGCYLCLYENPQAYRYPQAAPSRSRLLLAFDERGSLALSQDGPSFQTNRMTPDEVWPEAGPFALAAEPLFFQNIQLGYTLFEVGTSDGAVYETLRGLISSALEGALLMTGGQRHATQLQAAAEISQAASSLLEPEELLSRVVSLLSDRFGLAFVRLFLVEEGAGRAVLRATSDDSAAVGPMSESLIGECIENARTNLRIGSTYRPASLLSQDRTEMALPLQSRARLLGAISVRRGADSAFDEDEVKVFQTMADQVANSIENARLFDAYKSAELDLKRERNLLRTIIDQIPEYIYVKDIQSRFLLSNNSFLKDVRAPEELVGKTDFDFFEPALAQEYYAEERNVIERGESLLDHEHSRVDKDGQSIWILTSKVPLRDSRGEIIGLVGVSRDITERKRSEEALRRLHAEERERSHELSEAYKALQENQERSLIAEKMASLGRLTAGIAHEMNTLLATLRASLLEIGSLAGEYESSIADERVTAEDHREIAAEMKASIKLANTAAERALGFVRGMKTQTRNMGQVDEQRFKAVPVIEEALLLLSHALRKDNCELSFKAESADGGLVGSPGRLAQVVTNLVTNAIDASAAKGGGTIAITLTSIGESLELRVKDSGIGIPHENLPKIFDPLFTTKPIGQGTGLGLTIVHDVVAGEFGGTVDVESELGVGSTFILRFPTTR